jgi:hypothetical protein
MKKFLNNNRWLLFQPMLPLHLLMVLHLVFGQHRRKILFRLVLVYDQVIAGPGQKKGLKATSQR